MIGKKSILFLITELTVTSASDGFHILAIIHMSFIETMATHFPYRISLLFLIVHNGR